MANHALPTTTDTYANVLTYLHARIDDASKWYDSSLTYTNAPEGTVRWDSTALNWKKNTGTLGAPVWTQELSPYYNININGTVGATTAAAGTFTTLTVNTSAALPATATMGGSTIANLGSGAQTFTGSMSFTNASPIVSAKIGPATGQQHTIPAVTSDTIALIAASQTFTNKTYSSGALSGTFSGNHTISGQATFNEATAPIISAKLGPSAAQQHTLPAVASDTIALLAATQTFTNKTLTSPTISGGSIANAPISGSTGSFTTLASTSGYVQSPGLSSSYGVTSGTSTGAFNAVMGTAASATWLLSGTSGGTFRYGIQGLDAGGTLRFYTGTSWIAFDGTNLTNSSSHTFVTSANYNSYAPTLTGTGASGSWGINITGSAATLTTARTINSVSFNGSANIAINLNNNITFNNGGAGAVSGTAFSGSAATTISYNSIGAPSTTGTNASGTWGISITGSAGSASTASSATTAGSISGFNNPTTAATGNTIVYRDANAYIFGVYFNGTGSFPVTANANTSGMATFTGTNGTDNYARGYSAAAAAALLSGQTMNINGSSTSCSGNSATTSQTTWTDIYVNSWFRNNATNTGLYNQANANHFYSRASNRWGITGSSSGSNIYLDFLGTHQTTYRGSIHADTSSNIGFLNPSEVWSFRVDVSGNATATANVTAYSDERVKTNWRVFDNTFVEKLSIVKSGIYDRTDAELTQVGVSAQSLRKLMPDAVLEDSDGNLSVSYGNAALVACIELAKEIQALKEEIRQLKGV